MESRDGDRVIGRIFFVVFVSLGVVALILFVVIAVIAANGFFFGNAA